MSPRSAGSSSRGIHPPWTGTGQPPYAPVPAEPPGTSGNHSTSTPHALRPDLDPEVRDFVDGVHLDALDALHAAVVGDLLVLRRITARAADPRLLTYVLALMAGRALSRTGNPTPLLADIADRIEGDHP